MTTLNEVFEALQPLRPRALVLTKNRDDADDLMHDTFIRAARFLDKFGSGQLGAWLNVMMYRVFLDGMRSGAGSTGAYTYVRRMLSIETMPGFDIPCESTAESEWDCARIIELAGELTPMHKVVLELAVDGASYDDISRALGCPMGTVKSRLKRAREELQAKIAA